MSDDIRGAEPTGDAQNPWLPQDPPADQPYVAPQGQTLLPGQGQPFVPAPDQPQVAVPTNPPTGQPQAAGADQPYLAGPVGPPADQPHLPGPDEPYAAGPDQPFVPGPDQQQYLGGDFFGSAPTKRRSWLMPVLGGIAAVAVLLGSVVGVKLYRTLSGGGPQPEQWAPASTFAFAKVDLDPPAGAKVGAYQFSQKFPSVPRAKNADGLKDQLLRSMFEDAPVDYDADIKPWVGDRLAVAAFTGSDGSPQVVYIVAIKNTTQAERVVAKITADDPTGLDVDVETDFLLISTMPGAAHAAAQAARAGSLADAGTYKSDARLLHSDRIITAWFDIDQTMEVLNDPNVLGGLDSTENLNGNPALDTLTEFGFGLGAGAAAGLDIGTGGRAVVGVRLAADYLELEGRIIGSATTSSEGGAGQMLGDLGSGTVAAIAVSHPDDLITTALTRAADDPTMGPYLQDSLDALGASLGLAFPEDLANMLGSAWVVSLDAMPTERSGPAISSRSRPNDVTKAQDDAQAVLDGLGVTASDLPLDVRVDGKDLLVTFGQAPASPRKLADTATYKSAMGSLPTRVQMAGYLNMTSIWDMALADEGAVAGDGSADARVVKAIGLVVGADSSSSLMRLRVVVGG